MVAQRLGRLMMLEPQNQFELNEAFGGEEDRFRFSFLAAFLDFFAAFLDFFDFLRLEDEDESESDDDLSAIARRAGGPSKASWEVSPPDPDEATNLSDLATFLAPRCPLWRTQTLYVSPRTG
jgi:hypothetical protein